MNNVWTQLKNICTYALFFGVGVLVWPQGVGAFFSNVETAPAQQFQASSLVLETVSVPDSVTLINDNEPVVFPLNINTTDGSAEALYDLEVSVEGSSDDWCNSLFINATSTANNFYNSLADDFATNPEASFGWWQIGVYTDDVASAPVSTNCTLSMTVSTWQENLSKGVGYQDTQTVEFEVLVGDEVATFETFSFTTEESVESKSSPEGEVKEKADETNQGDIKETETIESQTEATDEEESTEPKSTDQTSDKSDEEETEKTDETSAEDDNDDLTKETDQTQSEDNELAHEQTHELTHEQASDTETEEREESEPEEGVGEEASTKETKDVEPESPASDDDKNQSSSDSEKSAVDESEDKSENNPPQQDNQGDGESEKGVREEESNSTETEDESKSDDV